MKEVKRAPPIILCERYIKMAIGCPACGFMYLAKIINIKDTCPKCNKPFEKDISKEDRREYDKQAIQFVNNLIIKNFQVYDEIPIHYNDYHIVQIHAIKNSWKTFGIEAEDKGIAESINKLKQVPETVNVLILKKSEQLKYYTEEEK